MLRGSWILGLFPYDIVMRGLSEYKIRAADSISPPLAFGGGPGSVSSGFCSARPGRGLSPAPRPGFWILYSGLSEGRGVWAARGFWILYSGNWAVGGTVDGCGPPGFCILDSVFWGVEGGRAARILYSAFCILPATCACDAYAWEQGWH